MGKENESYIISLIREGKANKEIAEDLHTTEGAVKNRIHQLLRKYKCKNRVQLAMSNIVSCETIER